MFLLNNQRIRSKKLTQFTTIKINDIYKEQVSLQSVYDFAKHSHKNGIRVIQISSIFRISSG
ncbi:unnamed protein product [Paramecium primaurelia]|uniref:Uncharacterized protein n=1 Tax=Paramecium primaurelia TaxID=5886 RepID=A0A8S1L948_PARPR|nr:unnamed protein product [Paramecium primaurelia]